MLEIAAMLEYELANGKRTVPDARYAFLEQYPESNHLPDFSRYDDSILSLIIPYPDSLHEIPSKRGTR